MSVGTVPLDLATRQDLGDELHRSLSSSASSNDVTVDGAYRSHSPSKTLAAVVGLAPRGRPRWQVREQVGSGAPLAPLPFLFLQVLTGCLRAYSVHPTIRLVLNPSSTNCLPSDPPRLPPSPSPPSVTSNLVPSSVTPRPEAYTRRVLINSRR